jgi:hypothetical protein
MEPPAFIAVAFIAITQLNHDCPKRARLPQMPALRPFSPKAPAVNPPGWNNHAQVTGEQKAA